MSAQSGGITGCGLTFGGLAYCWGDNLAGAVGDGTLIARLAPVAVTMPAATAFSQLSVGAFHVCAVAGSGAGYCWGNGGNSVLGNGSGVSRSTPFPVTMPVGVTFTAISAGINHTCALTALGAVYCWGNNGSGQLGDGTTTSRNIPVRVQR